MVIFWDASALLPIIADHERAEELSKLLENSENPMVWTLTDTEILSALCRLKRENQIDEENFQKFREIWKGLKESLSVIEDVDAVKGRAERILQTHPLKAADALQLSAALIGCMDETTHRGFVTLDSRLAEAARKEGFEILPQHER